MTHVCIPVHESIWDGFGLRLEIHDWLVSNVGQQASDMTDYTCGPRVGFYMRATESKTNPMYLATGDRQTGPAKFLHFLFKDHHKAVMFKLTWGGL